MPQIVLEAVANSILGPLDLTIEDGEALAVLGPSGAGKSTLLKTVAGLVPHSGRILRDGRDMSRLPSHRRDLGYMAQAPMLFPHLSVAGALRLVLSFDRACTDRPADRIRQTLELCAIAHKADQRPACLSGGERQRGALARALVRRPRLLLLDEPFSSLDGHTRRSLWEQVSTLRRALGMTMVLVTHDPEEAATLADRTVTMADGRLAA